MEKNELEKMRHSAEHVMHQALVELFPGLKRAMGPATDEGFYHDCDYEGKITEEDFPKIEKRMKEIIDADLPIFREEITIDKAREMFKGNEYKLDWVDQIEKRGEKATVYWNGKPNEKGSDVDLCKGPHVESTGKVGAFKLLSVAGAYWHGDSKNKMLTRIYGTAFPTQKELDEYLTQIEEAKKRDHKKLGQHLELFMFHETAPGMPYWLPKGVILYNELINFWREEHSKRGYQEIVSPILNKKELYVTSGHYDHYWQDMFVAKTDTNEEYGVKAMNCPNAMNVFGYKLRSYKDLPLRLSDTDTLHRNEISGSLNGLFRVREFRQDDAHCFVTEDQVENEYEEIFKIVERFYSIFGMEYSFRLGTRPESFMGDKETWDRAEASLKKILENSGRKYFVEEGDGAFYGPKIDILMKDAIGREWQMGTIQLDFQMPRRFKLEYIDADGKAKTPIAVHRVIYGSLERFIGILIEHYSGALPAWISPVQAILIPIADRHVDFCENLKSELQQKGIRIESDSRSESMQGKIRDAQLQKIPYMLVVGDKEVAQKGVAVRSRSGENVGFLSTEEFQKRILEEISQKH